MPFKPETLELDPQGEVLERLFWTANVAGDAVWRSSIEEFLDLKKFIRHLAIENFLAEEDGLTGDYGPNNFYFYRFVNTNRFTFLPWDKSNTFWESPSYSILRNIEDGTEAKRNRLVVRALKETDLRELWLNTHPRVRRLDHAAGGHVDRGCCRRWRASRTRSAPRTTRIRRARCYTNADFEESIRFLTTWAQTRSDNVRAQVAADRAKRGVK